MLNVNPADLASQTVVPTFVYDLTRAETDPGFYYGFEDPATVKGVALTGPFLTAAAALEHATNISHEAAMAAAREFLLDHAGDDH